MNSSDLARRDEATPFEVRDELSAARARVAKSLEAVESTLQPLGDWREAVRRHPLLAAGAAFTAGYVLARLFSRSER